ncbi:hypothetical protein [Sphingomonas panacis]|uniref:hypothetical protein n=1 Tax=Sphingomonas panacis TaxID=1560345 RepID=UPI0014712AEE|nr:hypothetical protein [Sphingomonas panacis]
MLEAYIAHVFPSGSNKEVRAHHRASLALALTFNIAEPLPSNSPHCASKRPHQQPQLCRSSPAQVQINDPSAEVESHRSGFGIGLHIIERAHCRPAAHAESGLPASGPIADWQVSDGVNGIADILH